ncbi:purine-nucleoside phosphorylase [Desulfovibrio mangrovi]|uniref:purine-nucleoside phosphorylase n=1 Tax=Desulfovibrio mangrovi TaxID=2976983 RepID=UPI0022454A2A|nr:purine-nucleoside phosphorylase [Desulfovibrio mangrovi]UZP67857.1 purine-nucleoside phosphorylase [Desulfovibrio mangrovi]
MQKPKKVQNAVSALQARLSGLPAPRVGIVLGTGLGGLAEAMQVQASVPYDDIPDFPRSTVQSHAGRFLFGTLGGVQVVMQQGRNHLYEGYGPDDVCMGVRCMAALGIETFIVTNAAGCLNPQWDAGDLMVITDHINFTGRTPLAGENHDAWGPRFPDMSRAYDPALVRLAMQQADELGIRLERGVYVGVQGPQMETPAETRMFKRLGADAVGMSTVMEVIAARHMSLKVLGFSCLTNKNLPDCMEDAPIEVVIAMANKSGGNLARLIESVVTRLA